MAGLSISTGKIVRPQKVCLYGPEGIGKTTLASQFPDPLFIDTEGSTIHLDVKRVDPAPSSWTMLLADVNAVIADPSVCQTLVIDTADWAERLCVEAVLDKNRWSTIESPGYGKGYREVNEEFGRLLDKLSDVVNKGVNVVVTAHARIAKFEQPDELGAYDRWSLKLFDSPKSSNAAMLKEWADMVLFLNYKTTVAQPDSKTGGHAKAVGGKRVMYTTHTPAWDAKNRCGLADMLPMEYAAIAGCIPVRAAAPAETTSAAGGDLGAIIQDVRAAEAKLAETNAQIEADRKARAEAKAAKAQSATPTEPTPAPDPTPPPAATPGSSNLDKLMAALDQANLPESAVREYCAAQGWAPVDVPLDKYPDKNLGFLLTKVEEIRQSLPVPFD